MLDRATRPTPRLLIFTVAGLRIPGDKFCSSAGGLQLKKYYRRMNMVEMTDDLKQAFRATGESFAFFIRTSFPVLLPCDINDFSGLKLRASEFRQLVPYCLLHKLQHPRTIAPLVLLHAAATH
ncbi:uncharacterized protein [Miscanthus floridulus]|uniref:uncharacterized protein n=1 Tax=Miscanthus floridulus TaxID=154761 RepID=UPI00345928E5